MFTRSDGRGGRETEMGAGGAVPRAVPDRELRSRTILWRSAGGDWTKVCACCLTKIISVVNHHHYYYITFFFISQTKIG